MRRRLAAPDRDPGPREEVARVDGPGLMEDRPRAVVEVVRHPVARARCRAGAGCWQRGCESHMFLRAAVEVAADGDDATVERHPPRRGPPARRAGRPAARDRIAHLLAAPVGAQPERPHRRQPPAGHHRHPVADVGDFRANAVAHQHRGQAPAIGAPDAIAVAVREDAGSGSPPRCCRTPRRCRLVHCATVPAAAPEPAEDDVVQHHVADCHRPAARIDDAVACRADDVAAAPRWTQRPH